MDTRFTLRLAAVAGWVALVGVVGGLILLPTLLAGQPPTIRTPLPDVNGYFGHREFIGLFAVASVLLAGVPILPFGLGLRQMTGEGSPRAAVMARIGFVVLVATIPVYVVSDSLGGALAALAGSDSAVFGPLHQLYELLYNGAADVLEAAWIGAFSVALLDGRVLRWVGWLGVALAISRVVKAFVPITDAVPEAVIAISGVLFLAWFLAIVVALTLRAWRPAEQPIAVTAPA